MVAEVEPRRVKCAMCGTWLKLSAEREYCPHHWAVHKKRCKERERWVRARAPPKPPAPPRVRRQPPAAPLFTTAPLVDGPRTLRVKREDTGGVLPPPPPAPAPAPAPAGGSRLTEDIRRRQLEEDPDVRVARADAVQCNMCERWIKLSNSYPYASGNWSGYKGHKGRCRERHPHLTQCVPRVAARRVLLMARAGAGTTSSWRARRRCRSSRTRRHRA